MTDSVATDNGRCVLSGATVGYNVDLFVNEGTRYLSGKLLTYFIYYLLMSRDV